MAAEEGFGTEKECSHVLTASPPHPRALCLALSRFPDRNTGRNSDIRVEHVQAFLSSFPKHRSAKICIAFMFHEALKVIERRGTRCAWVSFYANSTPSWNLLTRASLRGGNGWF